MSAGGLHQRKIAGALFDSAGNLGVAVDVFLEEEGIKAGSVSATERDLVVNRRGPLSL